MSRKSQRLKNRLQIERQAARKQLEEFAARNLQLFHENHRLREEIRSSHIRLDLTPLPASGGVLGQAAATMYHPGQPTTPVMIRSDQFIARTALSYDNVKVFRLAAEKIAEGLWRQAVKEGLVFHG